jgi:glycerate 2-kinase
LITEINVKATLLTIINSGIDAVKPDRVMREKIRYANGVLYINNESFDLTKINKVYVIGFGKVSAAMAMEIEKILGDRIAKGLVITNNQDPPKLNTIEVRIGNHPILDEKVLAASEEIISTCNDARENDLVICLISGGGSALFEKLPDEISLQDLQAFTKHLITCGASITEVNRVRKCFSLVKNGRLLSFIKPAKCISLIISDVVSDNIGSVASSPTHIDQFSFKKAHAILQFYNLFEKLPKSISEFLIDGLRRESQEEVMGNSPKTCANNFIIGSNFEALIAAEKTAKKYELNTTILTSKIQGEAREIAKIFGGIIEEIAERDHPIPKPACIIAGGETIVTVRGQGLGGRNQELALATLISLEDSKAKYGFASCGSDGIDGVTLAAGGFVHNKMWNNIRRDNIQPNEFLNHNDSFQFLNIVDGLIYIPPGQTNVMDIMVGIIY